MSEKSMSASTSNGRVGDIMNVKCLNTPASSRVAGLVVARAFVKSMKGSVTMPNELKPCDFCCYLDFEDSNGKSKVYPKENYKFYAGYSKQFDVDEFDEYETENINFCPVCGRTLEQEG